MKTTSRFYSPILSAWLMGLLAFTGLLKGAPRVGPRPAPRHHRSVSSPALDVPEPVEHTYPDEMAVGSDLDHSLLVAELPCRTSIWIEVDERTGATPARRALLAAVESHQAHCGRCQSYPSGAAAVSISHRSFPAAG